MHPPIIWIYFSWAPKVNGSKTILTVLTSGRTCDYMVGTMFSSWHTRFSWHTTIHGGLNHHFSPKNHRLCWWWTPLSLDQTTILASWPGFLDFLGGYTMVIPWLYHCYTTVIPLYLWSYHGYTRCHIFGDIHPFPLSTVQPRNVRRRSSAVYHSDLAGHRRSGGWREMLSMGISGSFNMEVLYDIRPYFLGVFPYIGLT